MSSNPQGNRLLRISGPALPADTFLHVFRGRERLGRPFKFKIMFSCADGAPQADKFLGSSISVTLRGSNGDRTINGVIAQFGLVELGGLVRDVKPPRTMYRAIVRPQLWRLTRSSHCRFFHGKNVIAIAKSLLDEHKVPYRDACTASYPEWDNCTQYRETDFNFLNRLLQREGIYYYFEHTGGKDTLVLIDDPGQHDAIPGYETIPFNAVRNGDGLPSGEVVYDWKFDRRVVPGHSETNSFDFQNVGRSTTHGLVGKAESSDGNKSYVVQEPDLWYVDDGNAKRYAQARLDAHLPRAARVLGRSGAAGMCPGAWFKLSGHPYAEQNGAYLVTDVKYRMDAGDFDVRRNYGGDPATQGKSSKVRRQGMLFDCRFSAIPKAARYRAPCWAAVPVVGPQTAIVVAPDGNDFATDAYGRIKVQFHWEQFDSSGSGQVMQRCWVRVAQTWAGDRWGTQFLPRKGQEVLVDFLNGDPDKPVVVGGLYNGKNKPPYVLPDAAAVSTILTQGTGSANASKRNELRFNDEKLQILLYTDGHNDHYVRGDGLTFIGNDAHTVVKKRQLIEADSQHITVSQSQNTKAREVSLNASLSVVHQAGEKYVVKGEIVHIKAGAELVLEASAMVSIKVGPSFVAVSPDGVHISGPLVYLNSGGSAGSGPGGSPASPDKPKTADDGKSVKRN
ncbi:MAG TPA: type VI secretion system tip protein TssI/VgrG [Bordetella sp.]|nr:type VI secretion system tip protein TssI/VgrG [Bordetella sp.]